MALKLYEEGLELLAKKDYKKAINKFKKALEKADSPTLASRCRTYISICEQKEEIKKSKEKPTDYGYAVFLINEGQYQEASQILKTLAKKEQESDTYNFLLAIAEAGSENIKNAEKFLKKAVKLNPSNKFIALKDPLLKQIAENIKGF